MEEWTNPLASAPLGGATRNSKLETRNASLPVQAARNRKHRGQDAEEQAAHANGHQDNHGRFNQIGQHPQLDAQLVLIRLRNVLQGTRDVAGFLADLEQVDHELRKESRLPK